MNKSTLCINNKSNRKVIILIALNSKEGSPLTHIRALVKEKWCTKIRFKTKNCTWCTS